MMGLACWCHGPASAPPRHGAACTPPGVSQCVVYRFSLQIRFPLSSPSWTCLLLCPSGALGCVVGMSRGLRVTLLL